ncbi:helix-turn-helix domain-containing protein [Pediococcus acidilactici]
MSIGPALQKVRQDRHLTQAEVASQLYVTRQTISRWEQGKTIPNIYALKDLAELYGVSIDELTNTSLLNPVQEEGDPMKQVNWMALFGILWFNVLFTAGAVVAVIGTLVGLWVTMVAFIGAPLLLFVEWLAVMAYHLPWPESLTWYEVPLSLIFAESAFQCGRWQRTRHFTWPTFLKLPKATFLNCLRERVRLI